MKIELGTPIILQATYWGDETGARKFDILVDGQQIATQSLGRDHGPKFFTVDYPVPADLAKDKDTITVRFQSQPGNTAGGLFGLRTLRSEP